MILMASAHINDADASPIRALLDHPAGGVLAVIAGIEGPSYRPMGAMMAIMGDGTRVGTLSSGCIEADIALHAAQLNDAPRMIRYGKGSPYVDIVLPCGGGLDVLIIPAPDLDTLADIVERMDMRQRCSLLIDTATGDMTVQTTGVTQLSGQTLCVAFEPPVRFVIFGKGPEASTFAALVQSVGYPNLLASPDTETLAAGAASGCATQHMTQHGFPANVQTDDRTAIILFFHDHDWEPPILTGALDTDAFYVGSQGSQRARDTRIAALETMQVSASNIAKLRGPVGLIPSARDARTLAISVLAEILAVAMNGD